MHNGQRDHEPIDLIVQKAFERCQVGKVQESQGNDRKGCWFNENVFV